MLPASSSVLALASDLQVETWSDQRLIAEVASIVSQPRHDPADSFVLHAPLELAARASLLPRVSPEQRTLARLHILSLAREYQEAGRPFEPPHATRLLPKGAEPIGRLIKAVDSGDLDEVDRAVVAVTSSATAADLLDGLVDWMLPFTSAAAHGPIFLYHLSRLHPLSGVSTDLLRPLARELARAPSNRISWIESWEQHEVPSDPSSSKLNLRQTLASTRRIEAPQSTSIHPLIMSVDGDMATELVGASVADELHHAARVLLSLAAQSMLEDSKEAAPYGWSHCLTIPQAVLGLTRWSSNPTRVASIAATHLLAFRSGLGRVELGAQPPPTVGVNPADLATAAGTSHDAHVVKYILACLDAASAFPEDAPLYYFAAQRLLDVWKENGGDPTDPLADFPQV